MNFIEKQKQKFIDEASKIVIRTLKRDILKILGEDAREEDVSIINQYFDEGIALGSIKKELTKEGMIKED